MGQAPKRPDAFAMRVADELFTAMPADMSLREFGRQSGLSHSMLSRFRSYEKVIDVDQLEAMCLVLKVEPHVIVERAERRGGGTVVQFPAAPMPPTDDVEERAALGHDVEAELEAGQIEP